MDILYPAIVLIGLTLFLIMRLGYLRFVAIRDGTIDVRYFRVYEGYEEPEQLRVHSRHVINLFESPVLFYTISIIAYVADAVTTLAVVLAWSYVVLRFVHSYIHLTTNTVLLRFRFFVFGLLALTALWVTVTLNMYGQ